jgi:phage terminase small subunit
VAKNSDWEGSEEIAARIAKSIPPNYIVPNKDDLNPQIEALISGLHQQLQQQSQQINAMGKELQDRQKDRDVAEHGIMKTFEAKVLAIAQKMEQTTQDASVKREAHLQSTIGRQLQEISKAVQSFEQTTKQPKQ